MCLKGGELQIMCNLNSPEEGRTKGKEGVSATDADRLRFPANEMANSAIIQTQRGKGQASRDPVGVHDQSIDVFAQAVGCIGTSKFASLADN